MKYISGPRRSELSRDMRAGKGDGGDGDRRRSPRPRVKFSSRSRFASSRRGTRVELSPRLEHALDGDDAIALPRACWFPVPQAPVAVAIAATLIPPAHEEEGGQPR